MFTGLNVYPLSLTTLKSKLRESRGLICLVSRWIPGSRTEHDTGVWTHSRLANEPAPQERCPPHQCPEEPFAVHPVLSPHLSVPSRQRPCSTVPPPPQRACHTSLAFSWPTSPEAACLARPLSSSPSPFTWLWEAMRCVLVVLFTSSIFILQTLGMETQVENEERAAHTQRQGYHAAVTRAVCQGPPWSALHWREPKRLRSPLTPDCANRGGMGLRPSTSVCVAGLANPTAHASCPGRGAVTGNGHAGSLIRGCAAALRCDS